ncbi:MAG: roadblock/LC7 domain-containing protein [Acidimicrobiales bacterium]
MTTPEQPASTDGNANGAAGNLDWLLSNFVGRTPGVTTAVAVSADGFLLASSSIVSNDRPTDSGGPTAGGPTVGGPTVGGPTAGGTEQFAAIISGLNSLTKGAADLYAYGKVTQLIVEMEFGNLFVMAVDTGSTVGVVAEGDADIGAVAYEMALLIDRVGTLLTPSLIEELKNSISLRARGR